MEWLPYLQSQTRLQGSVANSLQELHDSGVSPFMDLSVTGTWFSVSSATC